MKGASQGEQREDYWKDSRCHREAICDPCLVSTAVLSGVSPTLPPSAAITMTRLQGEPCVGKADIPQNRVSVSKLIVLLLRLFQDRVLRIDQENIRKIIERQGVLGAELFGKCH